MSEIPEDITKSARALCDRIEAPATQGTVYVIADEIFRWVLRERERCALVADFYSQASVHAEWGDEVRGVPYYACGDVANAIRDPSIPLPNPSSDVSDDLPF